MNLSLKYVLACLLVFTVGCHKRPAAAPPVQAQAPPPETPPVSSVGNGPPLRLKMPPPAQPTEAQPVEQPKPAPKKHKLKQQTADAGQPQQGGTATTGGQTTGGQTTGTQQVAANGEAPADSAIGQLSEGGGAASGSASSETSALIADTEHKLQGITRPLSAQEQKTVAQVHKFLQQSRDALQMKDADAAHTLAVKAKLLLDELLK